MSYLRKKSKKELIDGIILTKDLPEPITIDLTKKPKEKKEDITEIYFAEMEKQGIPKKIIRGKKPAGKIIDASDLPPGMLNLLYHKSLSLANIRNILTSKFETPNIPTMKKDCEKFLEKQKLEIDKLIILIKKIK